MNTEGIRQTHIQILQQLEASFTRPMMHEIAWGERLLGIMGARGAGKTTLLLQHIRDSYGLSDQALYATLDTLHFAPGDLVKLAEACWQQGVEVLFLDEVHKFDTWSQELKNIYDMFPRLRVVFTASSLLHILQGNADLSRRAVIYHLEGLSFREFVQVQTGLSFPEATLPHLLANHQQMAMDIASQVKPLKLFLDYQRIGYYPYYLQGEATYPQKLMATLIQTLEFDIPYLRGIEISYVNKLKQLLHILAQSVPYKPNVVKLAGALGISRQVVLHYLHHLQDAHMIRMLYPDGAFFSQLKKPEKVYLWHPNHIHLLGKPQADLGNLRETYFLSQVAPRHRVHSSQHGDFTVDEKYTFEVGGRSKNDNQLSGIENGWIAMDDIEVGYSNRVPLWLFGWLY
jgi:predicted AAA+ superfamily ATPase